MPSHGKYPTSRQPFEAYYRQQDTADDAELSHHRTSR